MEFKESKIPIGNLEITIHDARNLRDTQTIGKQDPFVKMELGTKDKRTRTHDNGGTSGHWDETFNFVLKGKDNEVNMKLTVLNENIITKETIGKVMIQVSDMVTGFKEKWFQLTHDNKLVGEISVSAKFIPGIILEVYECKDLYDTQLLGRQDPYAKMTVGRKQSVQTLVCTDQGKNPKFKHQEFIFYEPTNDKEYKGDHAVQVEIWNSNIVKDELIGSFSFPFADIRAAVGRPAKWYPLSRKDKKPTGQVQITCTQWRRS